MPAPKGDPKERGAAADKKDHPVLGWRSFLNINGAVFAFIISDAFPNQMHDLTAAAASLVLRDIKQLVVGFFVEADADMDRLLVILFHEINPLHVLWIDFKCILR